MVGRLEPSHKKYEESALEISKISSEIETSKKEMDDAEQKNEERQALKKRVEALAGFAKEEKSLLEIKHELEKRAEKARNIAERIDLHKDAIQRSKESLAQDIEEIGEEEKGQRGRLKQFAKELSKNEAFDLLRLEGRLAERIERITKERDWLKGLLKPSFIEKLFAEQREAQIEIVKVAGQVKKIGGGTFIKDEVETNLRKTMERLDKAKKRAGAQIDRERDEISKLGQQSKEVHFDREDSKRLQESTAQIKKVSSAASEYESAQTKLEKLPSYDSLIESLRKRIKSLGTELESSREEERSVRKE